VSAPTATRASVALVVASRMAAEVQIPLASPDVPPGRATGDGSDEPVDGETPYAYSLFQQPWWLDAVAPGAWSEVSISHGDRVVARLPYVSKSRLGLTVLGQPPLTQTLGPWIEPSTAKRATALGNEMALLSDLVAQLPRADRFAQLLAPQVLNALPFYWAGYDLSVRYTYRLDDLGSETGLWDGLHSSVRRAIRKARRQVEVRDDLGLETLRDLVTKTFARQGLPVPFPWDLVERIEAACARRGARQMLFAVDGSGHVHAATYVVHDSSTAYNILSGAEPELRASGAGPLLLWDSIMRVTPSTEVFDFEGSMLPGIEIHYRHFGGRLTPYLFVTRNSARMRALLAGQELARNIRQGAVGFSSIAVARARQDRHHRVDMDAGSGCRGVVP
jgi:hypothetical protein